MTEPDFSILLVAANRCLADRLGVAVAEVGGEAMRPSFGFVIRAVAAERPTVSRLAELLGVSKQAASRLADDMVRLDYLQRAEDAADRRRVSLRLTAVSERIMARARRESAAMQDELRDRFGAEAVTTLRELLTSFVVEHGGEAELAANRTRAAERG